MAAKALPSISDLRKALDYDPETGALTWRARSAEMFSDGKQSAVQNAAIWNGRFSGKPALCGHHGNGYLHGTAFDRKHYAHRVAWAIHYGEWPEGEIDHINGDRTDNRISNLRAVTRSENQRNAKRRADNASSVTGVYWRRQEGKWSAQIFSGGRRKCLGCFTEFDAAVAARRAAEIELGFHPNHGRTRNV